jgi:TolA-binding protein
VCAADAKTTPPAASGSKKPAAPASPQEAVEAGLAAFRDRKDYGEAVRLFRAAIDEQPGKASETAAAAWFNLGCAYAKQRKFGEAAEAIGTAINDHNLKLAVALTVSAGGCVLPTPWQPTAHLHMC